MSIKQEGKIRLSPSITLLASSCRTSLIIQLTSATSYQTSLFSYSIELSRLYRIRKTILQMLIHRGYIVVRDIEQESFESFREPLKALSSSEVRDQMMFTAAMRSDSNKLICVFFAEAGKLTTEQVRVFTNRMKEESVKHGLIVMTELTPHCRSTIDQINSEGDMTIETFLEAQLLVNITEHVLVPKHVLLSEEQVQELLKRYNVRKTQLPRIQVTDPIACYFGLKRGDVVKIIRQSETAGRYVTYRAVI